MKTYTATVIEHVDVTRMVTFELGDNATPHEEYQAAYEAARQQMENQVPPADSRVTHRSAYDIKY